MAKFARLADGTLLQFPDETDDSVIDATVKKHLGKSPKEEEGMLSKAGKFIKDNASGAMEDVGSMISKGASMLPGMGGQLASTVPPSEVSGAVQAGMDVAGAAPGMAAGTIAGVGTALAHGDPVGGRDLAMEVMGKSMPTAMMGMQPQGKTIAYDAMMKPFEHLTEAGSMVGQGYGNIAAALGASPDTAEKVHAGVSLAGLTALGVAGLGGKKSQYADAKKAMGQEHLTDAEFIDYLEQKTKDARQEVSLRGTNEEHPVEFQSAVDAGTLKRTEAEALAEQGYKSEDQYLQQEVRRQQAETQGVSDPEALNPAFGLDQPNKVVSSPVEPDGLSKGVEYGFEKNREPIKGTDVPDTTRPELRVQDPSEYTNTLPYSNTIHDYIYSRFPELTEKLQIDPVAQRLMMEVNKWTAHLKETLDMGGSEFAAGMRIKNKNIELMPDVRVEAGKELGSTVRSQAELNRLKAEYERSAQRLDLVVGQLSERLKSRSKAIGSDIADNAKFSDWVNEKLNSSGPDQGYKRTSITGEPYQEGAASANIQGQTLFGKGQRGSFGFKPDTPFEKFEKSLPAPYKGRAKELWADLEAKKAKPDFIANKQEGVVAEHIKTITGQEQNYVPITKPYKEIRDQILADKDINGTKVGQQLVSGAKMYAQQTKNLAIRFTADVVNASKKAQEVATYNKLFAKDGIISSWEKLSKKEQASLWDVVKKYKMKEWLDDGKLRAEGMNDKQITAYNAGRKHLEQTINDINAERTAHGESEITPMPGYFPSRWKGNFYFEVHKLHEDGRAELVRIETGNWKGIQGKGGLAAVRDRFAKEHPEYQVGEIVERPRYGDQTQTYSLYDNLVDTVGRDHPDYELLKKIFEDYGAEMADKTRNFRHHFDVNTGVEGYRGDSIAKTSYENAKDAMYSLEGYMRDAHNYIETKRAAREVNALLFDKEVAQPNAKRYIRDYWNASNGIAPAMAKMFDYIPEQMARSVGLSRYTPKSLVQDMKRNMMIFFLGFNRPVFLLSQAVQSLQFMPAYMLRMKADLGIKGWDSMIVSAQTKGYFDTVMSSTTSDKMTSLGKEAHKFAVEQRIVDTHFLDEIKNSGSRVTNDLTKIVTGQTALMWSEKFARSNAYYSFVHMLEGSGLKGNDLFKAAADATDIAMTNYVTHERAMIYKHFGIVGDMASPLTTFKHNYFSQLYLYGKEALKNPSADYAKPLLAFLTTAYVVGGYMGLPGRQELDWIIDMARAHGLVNPKTKNVTQTLASTTAKMQTGKDTVRYGVFSGATGMDVSPTFSAASLIPDHGISQMFPVVTKAAEMAGNVAKVGGKELGRMFGGQGSTMVDRAQLLKSVTPPAFKAGAEIVNQNPRTGMIPNPNDHMTGDVRRGPPSITDKNWLASGLGTNSIPESEQRTAAYQSKLQEDAIKQAKQTIIGQVKDLQTSGKPWSKEAKQYVDLGGTMNELVNAVKQNQMDQQQTREQRQRGLPKNINQGQKVQRMNEYGISK